MKISLSWLCNYLDTSLSSIDINNLVHLFNTHTAEIEHFEKNVVPLNELFIVQVEQILSDKIIAYCKELDQHVEMSLRSDAIALKFYLICKHQEGYAWTSLFHFGSEKEGLFPALSVDASKLNGSWKKDISETDFILEVDNKSINHRPDLWGHYGIAREVASILGLNLKPLPELLSQQSVVPFDKISKKSNSGSVVVSIEDEGACSRFAGLYCDSVQHKDSDVCMAIALVRVGGKPINAMVDITNYVMFDVGHPMHVFDADALKEQSVVVRKAKKDERITILDGQELALTGDDLVIANDKNAIALAGIMGGKNSGFQATTKAIFLEAAGFSPATIRLTAQRFKLRTEACIRFEKHLDPMQNIVALQRFVYLAKDMGIITDIKESIVSVGKVITPLSIAISHEFIEKKIGVALDTTFVMDTLQKLGFEVGIQKSEQGIVYTVLIPTNRMTKDIDIAEDIVEEVVRMYGYDRIAYHPIERFAQPFDTHEVRNISAIKKHLAFACNMHEVRDYLFFDEAFVQRLNFNPSNTISVKNPESQNWTRLVTSLVPHLIKNVELNITKQDSIRFFEWNRIWHKTSSQFEEQSSLAGIMFHKKDANFYDMKQQLQGLWNLLDLDVRWEKISGEVSAWYDEHKTAGLFVHEKLIGIAGMASQGFLKSIVEGQAFIFELDGEFLASIIPGKKLFKAPSKYQDASYDISLLVPLKVCADELQESIKNASSKIVSVELVDFFEKVEWVDRRALTYRYTISDMTKTLDKNDIDAVVGLVQKSLERYDVQVR